ISAYKARWQYLRTFVQQTAPQIVARKITQSFVAAFERWLIAQEVSPNGRADGRKGPISPRQQKNILEAAGTLWRKAQQFGLVAADLPNPFRCGSHGRRLNSQKFPGFEEGRFDRHLVGDFLDACDDWQRRIFLLMLSLGLRTDEVRHLLIEKFDWKNKVYVLDPMVEELGWNTKSGKWRLLPILPELVPLFSGFIGNRRPAGVLVLDKPIILESRAGLLEAPSLQAMCELYRELLGKHGDQGRRHASVQVQERLSEEVFLRAGALQRKRIYTEFQDVLKKLDVGKALWPHLTRGFAVSRAHQSGVDRFVALSVIGHANQSTFDRYCEHDAAFVQKEWAKVLDGNNVILDALARLAPPPGKYKA
ncbi:MAG: tyrosine-type recombinase/integrase, partial [Planctomycetes bacterium]|nr:tyrosine-type recombinase/integrase [Planctomycetota bacterium]